MAVIYAGTVAKYIAELERYYTDLRETLQGTPMDEKSCSHYQVLEDKPEPMVRIDMNRLEDCIGHFKVSVDALKRLKTHSRKIVR